LVDVIKMMKGMMLFIIGFIYLEAPHSLPAATMITFATASGG
jgi:hypothetical protein